MSLADAQALARLDPDAARVVLADAVRAPDVDLPAAIELARTLGDAGVLRDLLRRALTRWPHARALAAELAVVEEELGLADAVAEPPPAWDEGGAWPAGLSGGRTDDAPSAEPAPSRVTRGGDRVDPRAPAAWEPAPANPRAGRFDGGSTSAPPMEDNIPAEEAPGAVRPRADVERAGAVVHRTVEVRPGDLPIPTARTPGHATPRAVYVPGELRVGDARPGDPQVPAGGPAPRAVDVPGELRVRDARPGDPQVPAGGPAPRAGVGDARGARGPGAAPITDRQPAGDRSARVATPGAARAAGPDPNGPADVGDGDLVRFIERFGGREGVHARMWHDPQRGTGYSPVHAPLTVPLLRAHLRGEVTLGTYVVRADHTVRFVVLDVDAQRKALEAARHDPAALDVLRRAMRATTDALLRDLRGRGLDPVLVDSGYKGRHLWVLLDAPVPAGAARAFARAVVRAIGPLPAGIHVDLFPAQAKIDQDGLGNLVKLPLGVHLRSGRRAVLLDDDHRPLPDPFGRLRAVRPTPLPAVADGGEDAPDDPPVPEAPTWTEEDFARDPGFQAVLGGCAVLRAVVRRALRDGRMPDQGPVVLNHTLGHLERGPDGVNYLYERVPEVPSTARMGARHRGQPMGCAKIRQRLTEVVRDGVPCDCTFPPRPGDHPHPLRHLPTLAPSDHAALFTRLAAAHEQLQQARLRLRPLADEAARALRELPDGRWAGPGGAWVLGKEADGTPVPVWVPEEGAPAAPAARSGEAEPAAEARRTPPEREGSADRDGRRDGPEGRGGPEGPEGAPRRWRHGWYPQG